MSPYPRRKVAEAARSTVADCLEQSESKKKIAKSLGVTRRAVTKSAKSESRKTSGKESTADPKAVTGAAQQAPDTKQYRKESSTVPVAAMQRRIEPTNIANVMADVQSKIDCLHSCPSLFEKIEELLGATVNVPNNISRAANLAKFFDTTLRALKKQVAEGRAKQSLECQPASVPSA